MKNEKLKHITIIATTDVHGNIMGYNYEKVSNEINGGLRKVKAYIEKVRKENPNTILVDNGDIIQGTMLTDDFLIKNWNLNNPVISAMNSIGYSAMTLGNHEFNFGIDVLKKIEREAIFPFISANVIYQDNLKTLVKPYSIIEVDGVKIGIVGLTTTNVSRWLGRSISNLKFIDYEKALNIYLEEVKQNSDVIFLMAHSGLDGEYDSVNNKDGVRNIIELHPEIDIAMVGHYHITVKEKIGNTLVGGATDSGREVVRYDLILNENNKIEDKKVEIISMSEIIGDDNKFDNILSVKIANEKTIKMSNEIIGISTNDFQPQDEIQWISEGRLRATPLIQLVNYIQLMESGADVSATSLIREGADIKKGLIRYGDIYNIYKFNTKLYVVEITGRELLNYMEWTALAYNEFKKGDLSISFSWDVPGYQQDIFSGIEYKIDISKPKNNRIKDVKYKGRYLKDTDIIRLAISDYSYNSNLVGRNITKNDPIWESSILVRDMIVSYIRKTNIISPENIKNWEIIGYEFDEKLREKAISLVRNGKLEIPYDKSLNIKDLKRIAEM